ncbi:group XIIA secretory phospholipase A2-like [Physella acuta]|uniref:group XIIA secretory phospholipase A2-like n=1 Tax=Physella acuta TaxID=109671 RepID=UPI0027DC5BC7|nr:group XIIA secretory phospholipase A2-like [Physella acuta]
MKQGSVVSVLLLLAACCLVRYVQSTTASSNARQLLDGLQKFFDNAHEYIGNSKKGCVFQCPDGNTPKQNPEFTPTSNGCGAFGFKLEEHIKIADVTSCCDAHDVCYDTCNRPKDTCDIEFKECLEDLCTKYTDVLPNPEWPKYCVHGVDMIYAATMLLGCKPYRDAQEKACVCETSRSEL